MGFFSQNCNGCGHPALSTMATTVRTRWMNDVVAIQPNGSILKGSYDGYGRVGEFDEAIGFEATVWHEACWEVAGSPTAYTGPSEGSADQGWFFDDDDHDMLDPRITVKESDR